MKAVTRKKSRYPSAVLRLTLHLPVALAIVFLMALPVASGAQKRSCVDCHKDFNQRLKAGKVHDPVKQSCETCHKRHGFAQKLVLVKDLPDLCTDCHASVKDELSKENVHKALPQGQCTVCHDPHVSKEKALMRTTEAGSPVCLECHAELSAVMANKDGHAPFVEGECSTCHTAHASDNPALLVASEKQTCLGCHQGALEKHDIANIGSISCSDCHDAHTSSRKNKFAESSHSPFASGECDGCHAVEKGEIEIGDGFPAPDLCATCHDDVAGRVAGEQSHFGADALKTGGTSTCLECHEAHKGTTSAVLTKAEKELCTGCHTGLPKPGEYKGSMHQAFSEGMCSKCHEVHGGAEANHLVKSAAEVCASCHGDLVAAPAQGGVRHEALEALQCVECHSGHASPRDALLSRDLKEMCGTCHEKKLFTVRHVPYETFACDGCHKNHSTNPNLLAGPVKSVCGTCHPEQITAMNKTVSHPPVKDEDCTLCHAPHGSEHDGLLNDGQQALCTGCHDIEGLVAVGSGAEGEKPVLHTALAGGRCGGCHDPHGSDIEGLLVRQGENLCWGCHTGEKVEFAGGTPHKPVADGRCNECHNPHGSADTDLTVVKEPALCTKCHDFSKPPLSDAHKGFDVTGSKCTACHDPHTSAEKFLLASVVHEPFKENSCEACHESTTDASGLAVMSAAVSADACLGCHDDVGSGRGHQHAAGVNCTSCHAPHASKYEHLLKNPAKLCQGCHKDIVAGSSEGSMVRLHKPVEDGKCLDCHKMHEPAAEKYLVRAQRELCAGCHQTVKQQQGYANKHDPFAKGECSKCHATHASTERHLLRKDEAQLCQTCHGFSNEKMTKAHKGFPLTGTGCTTCHAPHAAPGTRAALVYPELHPPYAERDCGACHDDSGVAPGSVSTCFECHDGTGFTGVHNAGRTREESQKIGVCIDCHSPHAGYQGLFVRAEQAATCMQCHDRGPFSRKTVHAALDSGCTTCHDLHKDNPARLKSVEVSQICVECHGDAAMHAHPVGSEYKDPRNDEPLTCTSCHEAHSSDFEFMLSFDHKRDLCLQCHSPGAMDAH